jgi:hypothetical protein
LVVVYMRPRDTTSARFDFGIRLPPMERSENLDRGIIATGRTELATMSEANESAKAWRKIVGYVTANSKLAVIRAEGRSLRRTHPQRP